MLVLVSGPGNYEQAAHANNKQANMTATEYKTEFSMWAIAASPLTVTTPIMNCSQGTNVNVPTAGLRLKKQPAARDPAVSGPCNVSLVAEHSVSKCTLGASFGCNDTTSTMWTAGGCRGEFSCDGYETVCDVDGEGTHVCACGPVPPVICTPWISDLQKEMCVVGHA